MATEGPGQRPKYQRIADDLRAAIQRGEYGPGDRLPGENDLMLRYDVARMTARQALGVLQNDGTAEARKGAGVFVRAPQQLLRRHGTQRLARELWGNGRSIWSADTDADVTVDQVTVTEAPAPPGIADVLGLANGGSVCIRRRRYSLDGTPVMLATSYLPAAVVAGTAIAQEDTGPGGTYARLAELGHPPAHFREEIRDRPSTPDEATQLGLPAGAHVMAICRTAYTADRHPIEITDMTLDASAYVLEYTFDA
jgi:GntR family transcriptional regulator